MHRENNMPAKSKAQRKLMAMALKYKEGKMKDSEASDKVKELAKSMTLGKLRDFAKTGEENLPDKVEESIRTYIRKEILREGRAIILKEVLNDTLLDSLADGFYGYVEENNPEDLTDISLNGVIDLMYDYYREKFHKDLNEEFPDVEIHDVAQYLKDTMFV